MASNGLDHVLKFAWNLALLTLDSMILGFSNLIPAGWKRKKDIRDEIVLITGGGSGFGQLMAVKFAQLGCRVVIWGLSEKRSLETIAKVEREVSEAHKVHYYIVDVSDRVRVYKTAKRVKMDVGQVTILVNNAGIGQPSDYLVDTPDSLIERVMNVNTMSHFWTLKAFLPSMMENNHGHLVCISSSAVMGPQRRTGVYSASKAAVVAMLDSINGDLMDAGKTNVKTTAVLPYFSNTPFYQAQHDGLVPIVDSEVVVDRIVEAVLTNKEVVYIPHSLAFWNIVRFLTTKAAMFRVSKQATGDSIWKTMKVRAVNEL